MADAQLRSAGDGRSDPSRAPDDQHSDGDGSEPPLGTEEKRTVALLGVPTLGLALAVTMVTTYLPVVARGFSASNVVIGVIIGTEGLIALWLPLVVGTWSDTLETRIGGRLPFMVAASPIVVGGLIAMAIVSSVAGLAAATLVFFVGYFVAYEPYRALYPDAVDQSAAGRAQGSQAIWRGAGTGVALLSGGLLLAVGTAAPFLAAAAVFVVAMAVFAGILGRRGVPAQEQEDGGGVREQAHRVRALLRGNGALQAFLIANALWELSLAALKTFVVLYVTQGLGYSRVTASLVIGAVALLVLGAAVLSGKLADRFGHVPVLYVALPLYGVGLIAPLAFTSTTAVAIAAPFVGVGGGVVMTLPYALLTQFMPDEQHGAVTGYYSLSRGLGTWLGPLLGGFAVTGLAGVFPATQGYQAVWGVCSAAVLLSLLPLRRLSQHRAEAS